MDTETVQASYYTWESLQTLVIASGAVIVVANTARTLLKLDTPWIPFVVSVGLTVFGAHQVEQLQVASDWVIALLNSCLLFCTATGANQAIVSAKPQQEGAQRRYGRRPVSWLSPWLKDT